MLRKLSTNLLEVSVAEFLELSVGRGRVMEQSYDGVCTRCARRYWYVCNAEAKPEACRVCGYQGVSVILAMDDD